MNHLPNESDIEITMEVKLKPSPLNDNVITDFALRPGLVNNMNECFINSVMQCLAVSPFMHGFISKYANDDVEIINLITKYNLNRLKTDVLPDAIDKLLEMDTSISESDRTSLSKIGKKCGDFYIYICFKEIVLGLQKRQKPIESCGSFLSIARDISKDSGFAHLFSGEQNDPHEFLVYLLDRIHTAKSSTVKIDIQVGYAPEKLYLKLYLEHFKKRYENDFSMFVKNFYYYMLTCIECSNCQHVSYDVSPNDIMCVNLPYNWQSNPNLNIDACIADYFKVEAIDYRCEKCGNFLNNRQDKKILTRPKTIIIKLKRYTQMGNSLYKINKFIEYPSILKLTKYLCSGEDARYELYGVINHAGLMNGGHYYSFIRDYTSIVGGGGKFSQGWMLCNDTQVKHISEKEAFNSKNAYMLFYNALSL
jgi:ubiquitin C-terminal hydrolase